MSPATTAPCALLARVDGLLCALPIEHVAETMRPLPVEPLSGSPPFVLGVAVIRGLPTPVVDLAAFLSGRAGAAIGRFVAVRLGERRAALAVAGVLGVRILPPEALAGLPPLLRDVAPGVLAAVGTLDERLLLVLRSGWAMPEETWRALAAEEGPA